MNILRAFINNSFKENFYGKRKKINILTTIFISYKNSVKIFLKLKLNLELSQKLINLKRLFKSPKY